jgi:hypothetical protein
MIYTSPAIDGREPITEPFVLGVTYNTPTWTDQADAENQESA